MSNLLASFDINIQAESTTSDPQINIPPSDFKFNIVNQSKFLLESITFGLGAAITTKYCVDVCEVLHEEDIRAGAKFYRWDKQHATGSPLTTPKSSQPSGNARRGGA